MTKFFKRFLSAGVRAYSIPTLPDNILNIQTYPIIRILRFLGGFSLLMLLTKSYLNYPSYFIYFFYFFALIFTIYHFIISFYRIKHMLSVFKSETDKFDIRNSPKDKFASLGAKALWCLKGACETAQPVGVTLGLMITTDTILKEANREPIFTPIIGGFINNVFPNTNNPSTSRIIETALAKINQNNLQIEDLTKAQGLLENDNVKGGLSVEDTTEFQTYINENKSELIKSNAEIKESILDHLKKKK